jgi:hypothetical protein
MLWVIRRAAASFPVLAARFASAVLLFLLGIGLLYWTVGMPQERNAERVEIPAGRTELGVSDYGAAYFGGQKVAYLVSSFINCSEGASVRAAFFQEKPKKFAYLLMHPSVSTDERNRIYASLRSGVGKYGYSLTDAMPDFLRTSHDSVFISATGAVPEYIAGNYADFASRGNALLLVGNANYSIAMNGTVEKNAIGFSGGSLLAQNGKNADEIEQSLLFEKWQNGSEIADMARIGELWTVKWPAGARFARLAASATCGEEALHRVFDIEEPGAIGSVFGPATIYAGANATFDIGLEGVPGGDWAWTARREGAVLAKGFTGSASSGVLFGSFSISPGESGEYVISIEDIGGNSAANALLHVFNISASLLRNDGESYVFLIHKDGKPIASEQVEVGLAGSQNRVSCAVWNGVCEIRARPSEQNPEFVFYAGGGTAHLVVKKEGGQEWAVYAAAVVLCAAVIFAASRKRKPTYTIVAEEGAAAPEKRIEMKLGEMLAVFDLVNATFGYRHMPLRKSEVAFGIEKALQRRGERVSPSIESVEMALLDLARRGQLVSHGDFFAPSGWKEKNICKKAVMRQIVDICIGAGALFDPKRSIVRKDDSELRILVSPDVAQVRLALRKKAKIIIVFETSDELAKFRGSLAGGGNGGALVRLAMENGKADACTLDSLRGRI